MIDVKDTLKKISDLESELNKYFDNIIVNLVADMTDQYWTLFGEYIYEGETRANDVGWSVENPNDIEGGEHVYSENVRFVVRKDKYTLVSIMASTGGYEDLIFDNSKEIKEGDLV